MRERQIDGAQTHMRRHFIPVVLVIAMTFSFLICTDIAATASKSTPVPLLLTGVSGTPIAFVVSATSVDCASGRCLQLQRTSDNGTHFITLHLPPIFSARGSAIGNLGELDFANLLDGFARLDEANSINWYATTNGAESWHRVSVASGVSILQLVPTHHELYAVIAHCVKRYTCTDYRLARSALSATFWSTVAMPTQLFSEGFTLAAYGPNVWVNLQGPGSPLLFTSHDEGKAFSRSTASPLASVSGCSLTPMSPKAVWAECPTGMDVSFFHSSDGGSHWIGISRYSFGGTGGGAFDPVSGSLAYLNFGIFTSRAKDLYAITNSGHTMTAVGNLACTSTNYLVFSGATRGLTICQKNNSDSSFTYLLRTHDGGRSWTKVMLP